MLNSGEDYAKAYSPRLATTQPINVYFVAGPVKADPPLAGVGVDELAVGAAPDVPAWDGEVVVPAAKEGDVPKVELATLGLLVVADMLDDTPLELLP